MEGLLLLGTLNCTGESNWLWPESVLLHFLVSGEETVY